MRFEVRCSESIQAPLESVRAYFEDVPASMSGVPGVQRCEVLGGERYRTTHAELRIARFRLAAAYSLLYSSPAPDRIDFSSIDEAGAILSVNGGIDLEQVPNGTHVVITQSIETHLPVPRLLERSVIPRVRAEAHKHLAAFLRVARERLHDAN